MAHILDCIRKGLYILVGSIILPWTWDLSKQKASKWVLRLVQIPQTSEMPCRRKFRSWPTISVRLISLKTRCVNNFVGLTKRKGDWLPDFSAFLFFWNPPVGRLLNDLRVCSNCRMTAELVSTLEVPREAIFLKSKVVTPRCWELGPSWKIFSFPSAWMWMASPEILENLWDLPKLVRVEHQWFQMHFTISFPHQNWILEDIPKHMIQTRQIWILKCHPWFRF